MPKDNGGPKRHFVIPDIQARPGVPLDHCDWVGKAIAEYRPDSVINLGDTWDCTALNSHEEPGSAVMEGRRFKADVEAGNEAMQRISEPMERESKRTGWRPRKVFLMGNHENRADRAAIQEPKYLGLIGSESFDTRDWERHNFLEVVAIDGVHYSHYFSSSHSGRAIGGSVLNKLSKINASFVHGHVQGLDMGTKMTPLGKTLWGIAAGSCYTSREEYRGNQGQRHWVGVVVLNEVDEGEFCPMPLTLQYLCRKYTGESLYDYMCHKHPWGDWRHLACHSDLNRVRSPSVSGSRSPRDRRASAGTGPARTTRAATAKYSRGRA